MPLVSFFDRVLVNANMIRLRPADV